VARREHFGFADGLSQPRIAGVNGPETAEPAPWYGRLLRAGGGSGGLWPRGRADPNPVIRLGEFVLGYPDEDDPHPVLPEPADLFRNGSYLVVRKLAQDVPAFWAFARAAATEARHDGRDDVTVADVAARVMGRARDGTPLVDPAVPAAGRDFSFRDDPEGRHCPLGSHVRRSNPRDGAALGASDVNRHRLLRRGLPYGPPSPAAAEVDVLDLTDHGQARLDAARDGVERGIFFLCFGASISRQFEFVQRSWLNDGDALGIGHSGDVVSGAEDREATVTVSDGRRMARPAAVVTARGGEYFFTPGIGALRLLSRSAHSRSGDDRGRGATVIDAVSTRGGS
jgi:Dyp-type peroxidase family